MARHCDREKDVPTEVPGRQDTAWPVDALGQEDPSPDNINASVDQLYAIFANNVNMPSVQDDLKTIFG
jgi:hypothetical protein